MSPGIIATQYLVVVELPIRKQDTDKYVFLIVS
jgi:hypothetical protein